MPRINLVGRRENLELASAKYQSYGKALFGDTDSLNFEVIHDLVLNYDLSVVVGDAHYVAREGKVVNIRNYPKPASDLHPQTEAKLEEALRDVDLDF